MKGALLAMAILMALHPPPHPQAVERQVGPYLVRAYFQDHPHMDEKSILILQVVDALTGAPIPYLEEHLRVEGRVMPVEGVERPVPVFLRPARGSPGTYEAVFVPPAMGRYVFRISGRIEEVEVDLELETGPQGLPDILPPESDFLSPGALVGLSLLGVYLAIMAGTGLYYLRRRS
jgi:hypothetical protein